MIKVLFAGCPEPAAKTLKPIGNFSNFLTRKLYTYNAASCVIAYIGWKKGYSNYADAANDEEINFFYCRAGNPMFSDWLVDFSL